MATYLQMPIFLWRLIRVLLVVVGPVLAIFLLTRLIIEPEIIHRGEKLLATNAELIQEGLDRIHEFWRGEAISEASDPSFVAVLQNRDNLDLYLKNAEEDAKAFLSNFHDLRRLILYSKEGGIILDVGKKSAKDHVLKEEPIVQKQFKIQGFARTGDQEYPTFSYLQPIVQNDTVLGALWIEVDAIAAQSLLAARKDDAGPGATATLYDENGILLVTSFFSGTDDAFATPFNTRKLTQEKQSDPKAQEIIKTVSPIDFEQKLGSIQGVQVRRVKSAAGKEMYREASVRLKSVPWIVAYRIPDSSFYGILGVANLLILIVGVLAAGIAYFAFSPDRRSFESARARTFRPELVSLGVFVVLTSVTFYIRHMVFQLAEIEVRENGQTLAVSCSRQLEEFFNTRLALLRELSNQLAVSPHVENSFRERADRYRSEFGGDLILSWSSSASGASKGILIEGNKNLEQKDLPALAETADKFDGRASIALFNYPGGGDAAFLSMKIGGQEGSGTLIWVLQIADALRSSLAGVAPGEYQVTIRLGENSFPLYPQAKPSVNLEPVRSKLPLPGEDWEIEVQPDESLLSRRYGVAALIVTIFGLILAAGGALATYFGSTNTASLREASSRDALTGIRNRRAFNEMMEREITIAERYSRPLSLFILDLDHFKSVNDSMGHAAGDQVLQLAGETIQRSIRETDVAFRYGGEEFAVVMAETNLISAVGIAERVRMSIESSAFHTSQGRVSVTASLGVTSYRVGESADQFLTRADMALYRAKTEGRNRVITERPSGWEA